MKTLPAWFNRFGMADVVGCVVDDFGIDAEEAVFRRLRRSRSCPSACCISGRGVGIGAMGVRRFAGFHRIGSRAYTAETRRRRGKR